MNFHRLIKQLLLFLSYPPNHFPFLPRYCKPIIDIIELLSFIYLAISKDLNILAKLEHHFYIYEIYNFYKIIDT